ncbi:gliding motility-associated ABC transporter substrate-binding protein GldG [Cyclobacterium marinum]|uniref:Gliding-associated putative ABC transporter substrate-binding component GldG n=1 Tax=Cyclobacterium marinum (strain ATCC 25205 / DSM 745 / LMG 13164 / NCIMB 1802) TaxID=880070 RepID=G0IZF5_CYCMS|nr:gliding motility-associated ABC transporter substrate-binding protein GldG [Cyclobacterium marinum]AEL24428.1 gliding-associated putative ABC transporter substrate-binding component GldG [Cyclobacterium marinum DSM 745]
MNRKYSALLFGILTISLIWFLVINLDNWWSFRLDMTEEGKYSIGQATLDVLEDMDGPLEVDILLMGDLPPGMKRFQRNIEQILKTFRSYSPEEISINYVDPLAVATDSSEQYIIKLAEYGINPTNLHSNRNGTQATQLIFPGIVLRSPSKETGVLLLKGELGMRPEETLNLSIENLEFEIGQAIKRLYTINKRAIGVIIGQGEMEEDEGYGMVEALNEDFEVYKVPFEQAKSVADLLTFEVLIVAGPKEAYGEREKYLLDQFLMYGGNILFMMDQMAINLEEAGGKGTLAMPFDSGIDDLLFRYGVRINKDLIKDLNFGYYPVVSGEFGNQPQIVPLPWPFYVQAGKMASHPITKGLDLVQFRFVSSIDTVKADQVKKTPLIFSSNYSRRESAPVRVAFKDMSKEPDIKTFNSGSLPLAYLLEGKFTSFFKNRFVPDEFDKSKFLPESNGGKILVAGDADVFKSWVSPQDKIPLPLGNNPFSENLTANRTFLQNTVNYMVYPEGIIASKNKEFEIRPLNKVKIKQQRSMWQVINVVLPVLLVVFIGWFKQYLRKRKYSK